MNTSHDEVQQTITDAVGGLRIVAPPSLPQRLRPPTVVVDEQLTHAELDSFDGVLTTASLAIAETGTIVLTGSPGEGRRAITLIPDTHVCVVDTESVVETVTDAFDALGTAGFNRRPITFISGPSATSDIEMKRVQGVHGPRNLIVILSS